MTAVEHIICWIESSKPHYDRLLTLSRNRGDKTWSNDAHAESALRLVVSAYREMTRGGDAWMHDHSPNTLLDAAKAVLAWELET